MFPWPVFPNPPLEEGRLLFFKEAQISVQYWLFIALIALPLSGAFGEELEKECLLKDNYWPPLPGSQSDSLSQELGSRGKVSSFG